MVESKPTAGLVRKIAAILRKAGYPVTHLPNVMAIALRDPLREARLISSPKSAQEVIENLLPHYRAAFIASATRRVAVSTRNGVPLNQVMDRERRNYQQHIVVMKRRVSAAQAVDKIGVNNRRKVGWYAVLDDRTSPECRAANGKNFYADRMPEIGYPGAVHPSCRCRPGRPHATKTLVYSVKARDAA